MNCVIAFVPRLRCLKVLFCIFLSYPDLEHHIGTRLFQPESSSHRPPCHFDCCILNLPPHLFSHPDEPGFTVAPSVGLQVTKWFRTLPQFARALSRHRSQNGKKCPFPRRDLAVNSCPLFDALYPQIACRFSGHPYLFRLSVPIPQVHL